MGKGWDRVRVCSGSTRTRNRENRDPKTAGLPKPVSRLKHGRFLRKLRRGFFNLVYRLARIEGKFTAYPTDLTAKDFGKFDSLIKCFRAIHGELQPFVGLPTTVKMLMFMLRPPPV